MTAITTTPTTIPEPTTTPRARRRRGLARTGLVLALAGALAACGAEPSASAHDHRATTTANGRQPAVVADVHGGVDPAELAAAMLASAGGQDVEVAEAAGWTSTLDTLGCFQNPSVGGMGVHYLNASLMDATVDISQPEALVYELDASGAITGLVAHEYIVPVEAWTSRRPPRLFGQPFHRHPVLPLWVLHAWLWKDNPSGMFDDWNPAVRQCPAGVPIFGRDLPAD